MPKLNHGLQYGDPLTSNLFGRYWGTLANGRIVLVVWTIDPAQRGRVFGAPFWRVVEIDDWDSAGDGRGGHLRLPPMPGWAA